MEQPKRRGRPPKTEVDRYKKGNRGAIGRPKGDNAAIEEMKARLLASPRSRKVLDKIMEAALDDDHKHQAAAWKLMMDRLLPVSLFEKDKNGGSKPSVSITINGIGESVSIADDSDIIDVEDTARE